MFDMQRMSTSHRRLLIALALGLAVVALYAARDILLPIALAVLLSFVLAPLADRLERTFLRRIGSIIVVSALSMGLIIAIGWAVLAQIADLSQNLPEYRSNLLAKIEAFSGKSLGFDGWSRTVDELNQALAGTPESSQPDGSATDEGRGDMPPAPDDRLPSKDLSKPLPANASEEAQSAIPVRVVATPPSPVQQVRNWLGPLLEPITTAGLVGLLVVFILFQREDLRNRFLYLCGTQNLRITTEALHDATYRVSRYLLMALAVNMFYGMAMAGALFLLGVPNALLWGVLGLFLRFLPYVGPFLAAAMPIAVSFAVIPGWVTTLAVIGVLILLELTVNMLLEPWLYGHSVGVSTIGVIIAAIFWTWLWGPVGLVVAMPITVCLVVIAKYAPPLKFIEILLGDRSEMPPEQRIYQRLLALDVDEAFEVAEPYGEQSSLVELYDNVVLPVLRMLGRDRFTEDYDLLQDESVIAAAGQFVDQLNEHDRTRQAAKVAGLDLPPAADQQKPARILCVPAHDEIDALAATMVSHILEREGYDIETGSTDLLTSELVEMVDTGRFDVVVVSAMPPAAPPKLRYFYRRLREQSPDLPVVVGVWLARDTSMPLELSAGDDNAVIATNIAGIVKHVRDFNTKLVVAASKQSEWIAADEIAT